MEKLANCCLTLVIVLVFNANANTQGRDASRTRHSARKVPIVVFVCEHGAAKSVIAAAQFNKQARERNVRMRAIARGTNPDQKIAPAAARGLQSDGLAVGIERPRLLSPSDVAGASRVIAMCELPEAYSRAGGRVEQWSDIPSVSDNYGRARDAIAEHVRLLLDKLKSGQYQLR
jgi:protein-tyrosine-phosphatase